MYSIKMTVLALLLALLGISSADAQRVPAIDAGVDRLADLQRNDPLTPDWTARGSGSSATWPTSPTSPA